MIEIRKTTLNDLERVMEIYDIARKFMRQSGNATQWGGGYPSESVVKEDIERGESFVVTEDGNVHGVFMFMQRIEPTYAYIEDGEWKNDLPYGTIHRVASDGHIKRMFDKCVAFCLNTTENLRVDTHHDNLPMQNAIARNGFTRCGIVYMADGSKRIAYQR